MSRWLLPFLPSSVMLPAMKLILGSTSPRRREILAFFNIPFEQRSPPFDESTLPYTGDPLHYAQRLAQLKALSFALPDRLIVTADTVVCQADRLFLKPKDREEGLEMLRTLNGAWHTVYTAVCVRQGERHYTTYGETRLLFHHATERQLHAYHAAFNNLDKAGGYAIQQAGSLLVKKIEGCFYNVMGLPLSALQEALYAFGIDLWSHIGSPSQHCC